MKIRTTILHNKWLRWGIYTCLLGILFVVTSTIWVNRFTQAYIYDNATKIPYKRVCLVLGTSKYLRNGTPNLFFEYRIRAAITLYKNKKTDCFVVSGDNSTQHYDEPGMMREELMKRGVPACKITCDYAGFRTFDSVIRMWKIFGQKSFTVISQKFHNQRAVFLARKHGLDAIAYNAKDVEGKNGLKTHIREYFARTKAIIDLYIWPAQPKFLGEKVPLKTCADTLIQAKQ